MLPSGEGLSRLRGHTQCCGIGKLKESGTHRVRERQESQQELGLCPAGNAWPSGVLHTQIIYTFLQF